MFISVSQQLDSVLYPTLFFLFFNVNQKKIQEASIFSKFSKYFKFILLYVAQEILK